MNRSRAASPWVRPWLCIRARSRSLLKPYQPLKAFYSPPHRIPGTGTAGTTAVRRAGFYPTADASGVSGCLGTPWLPLLSLTPPASWQQGLKLIPPQKACQEIFSQPAAYYLQQVRKCFSHHAITFVLGSARGRSSSNSNKSRNH